MLLLPPEGPGGDYSYASPPAKEPCPTGMLTQVMRAGDDRACGELLETTQWVQQPAALLAWVGDALRAPGLVKHKRQVQMFVSQLLCTANRQSHRDLACCCPCHSTCAVNPPGYFLSYDAANVPFISPCPADTFCRGYSKQRQCTPW